MLSSKSHLRSPITNTDMASHKTRESHVSDFYSSYDDYQFNQAPDHYESDEDISDELLYRKPKKDRQKPNRLLRRGKGTKAGRL